MTTRISLKLAVCLLLGAFAGTGLGLRGASLLSARRAQWLLRQSITVGAEVPMRAGLTMTRRRHGQTLTTQARVAQGSRGRYRMEYLLPPDARGRIVTSDGQANWQYEPRQDLLARTQLIPENEQNERATQDLIAQNYRLVVVSENEVVEGRDAWLLELLPRLAGKSSQRRWIDRQTFKTLRVETHYEDGILARMVAYDHIVLPANVTPGEFEPPHGDKLHSLNSVADSDSFAGADQPAFARALRLTPDGALGFRLVQVASSSLDKGKTAHLLYSDGIESVSVFVQQGGTPAPINAAGWHTITINKQTAFENLDGHLDAIVWTQNNYRYTALSHLGPKALQQFVGSQLRGLKN